MSQLIETSSKYTDNERMEAAAQYAILGTATAVQRATGIPNQTICDWKKTEWFVTAVGKIREETNDKFISDATRIIEKATKRTEETLDAADCRTAATVGAIYYDKLRLALGQPTSISGKAESIKELQATFEQIAHSYHEKQVNVVDEQ